ncbi:hypothetical protein [Cuspidothrix issatschenkoi]|nr:hypothetical protein [Cuspidothrix issatschenkoi]
MTLPIVVATLSLMKIPALRISTFRHPLRVWEVRSHYNSFK